MIFIYDGTFEGFLSAVFDAYTLKSEPSDIVSSSGEVQTSFEETHIVETTGEKADRLIAGMEKIGFCGEVMYAFLADMPEKEMVIYQYIVMGFNMKEKIFCNLGDGTVRKVKDLCGQTGTEKQKTKGFLRFSIVEGNIHCAEISPKNNVLMLIMPHFCRRMRTMPFLIHDLTYRQVGVFDTRKWVICSSDDITIPQLRSDEKNVRYAWKLFYDTVAIEGRLNLKRRKQMIPERYRRHMTELQEQASSDGVDVNNALSEFKKL
jgi:probable DNA metabolism protein